MTTLEIGELRVRIEAAPPIPPVPPGSPDADWWLAWVKQCHVVVDRADPHIYVSERFLERLDVRLAEYGDGILTIHGRDGDVSYGLSHYDDALRQWLGTRCT
jgi:hypothetical protein